MLSLINKGVIMYHKIKAAVLEHVPRAEQILHTIFDDEDVRIRMSIVWALISEDAPITKWADWVGFYPPNWHDRLPNLAE